MTADKRDPKRPHFRAVQPSAAHKSPEDLFYKLTGRNNTHAYLRGPQQDVLREYSEKHAAASDVAFELPTGTGKTAVGLLIGEWRRHSGRRVAYLSLTNQLAGQVLDEGKRLDIPCADLRGSKEERNPAEEGRFKTRSAIGITTYSNLFNINPIIQECELLVLDDAHGAGQYVADMWTVTVRKEKDGALFESLLADLRPGIAESQVRTVLDPAGFVTVEMADVVGHPECISAATATLGKTVLNHVLFPWKLIGKRLHCCLFLISSTEISIRPLIPPTHTHLPFSGAAQRIYMSATLGGESDLGRAYGVESLRMIRAKSPQWGRRYVFIPGVYADESESNRITGAVWDGIQAGGPSCAIGARDEPFLRSD